MRLSELSRPDLELLDSVSDGLLSKLQDRYPDRVSLTIQTHHDGLPEGEMKLFITVDGEQECAIAKLGGSLIMLGWDIYLRDLTQSARSHIQRAHTALSQLDQASAPEANQQPAPQPWTADDLAPTRTLH